MDAEYILMTHVVGARDEAIWRGVAQDIRGYQRLDGSWALYAGAPGDLSTTIECYFALKLAGDTGKHLERAERFILAHGGIARARVFTRIWLAACGQWRWEDLPAMPIELMLLPARAPVSIYRFASWARRRFVPLLLLMNDRPVRPVPASASLAALRGGPSVPARARDAIDRAFLALDAVLRRYVRLGWRPLRDRARRAAEEWVVAHQEADGSWGGIQPPWVYSLMALHSLGYASDHPVMRKGLAGCTIAGCIRRAMALYACRRVCHRSGTARWHWSRCASPEFPPMIRRSSAPVRGSPRKRSRARRLERRVPGVIPSGWSFEFENDLYPDVDDSAWSCSACTRRGCSMRPRGRARSRVARDAERKRRLGRVRQGQHVAPAGADPVRRFSAR